MVQRTLTTILLTSFLALSGLAETYQLANRADLPLGRTADGERVALQYDTYTNSTTWLTWQGTSTSKYNFVSGGTHAVIEGNNCVRFTAADAQKVTFPAGTATRLNWDMRVWIRPKSVIAYQEVVFSVNSGAQYLGFYAGTLRPRIVWAGAVGGTVSYPATNAIPLDEWSLVRTVRTTLGDMFIEAYDSNLNPRFIEFVGTDDRDGTVANALVLGGFTAGRKTDAEIAGLWMDGAEWAFAEGTNVTVYDISGGTDHGTMDAGTGTIDEMRSATQAIKCPNLGDELFTSTTPDDAFDAAFPTITAPTLADWSWTNSYDVKVIHANLTTNLYDALSNAAAAISDGDTFYLASKVHALGYKIFIQDDIAFVGQEKPVYSGSSNTFTKGAIIDGSPRFIPPGNGIDFYNIGFMRSDTSDGILLLGYGGQTVNGIIKDCVVAGDLANTHNLELKGEQWSVDGLDSYNAGTHSAPFKVVDSTVENVYVDGGSSGIIIKGQGSISAPTSNSKFRNLSVKNARGYPALFIEADPSGGSYVEDVEIRNVFGDANGLAAVEINSANSTSLISGITIADVYMVNASVGVSIRGDTDGAYADDLLLENIYIDADSSVISNSATRGGTNVRYKNAVQFGSGGVVSGDVLELANYEWLNETKAHGGFYAAVPNTLPFLPARRGGSGLAANGEAITNPHGLAHNGAESSLVFGGATNSYANLLTNSVNIVTNDAGLIESLYEVTP